MSSYDQPQEYISMEEYQQSMRFVRLQIAIPISVLMSLGTTIVCSMVINPGIGEISDKTPTLLSPNSKIVGAYGILFFFLQVGMCLLLIVARGDETKKTFVNGVGVRIAIANWILTAWAVCWILEWFSAAGVLVTANLLIVLSIHLTLYAYTPRLTKPLTAIFVHVPISLFVALSILMFLHSGAVALHWVIKKSSKFDKWLWPALIAVLSTHIPIALWECFSLQYVLTLANEAMLVSLILFSPRADPGLPKSSHPKPPPLVFTLIGMMALHPLAIACGLIWSRRKNQEGRIRLEEEVEAADERLREAEAEAEAARQAAAAADA